MIPLLRRERWWRRRFLNRVKNLSERPSVEFILPAPVPQAQVSLSKISGWQTRLLIFNGLI